MKLISCRVRRKYIDINDNGTWDAGEDFTDSIRMEYDEADKVFIVICLWP